MSELELSQDVRKTTGEVPPSSVGSTITIVGRKLYVVAGRLVQSRKLTTSIYVLDLETFVWTRLESGPIKPAPRYFHSANTYGTLIVIFGGMSTTPGQDSFCVLNDVAIFDTITHQWTLAPTAEEDLSLRPRYAHLSAVSAGKLVVLGGQDKQNDYLEDAGIFDLTKLCWEGIYPLGKQCGAYRSLTVTSSRQMIDLLPPDVATELDSIEEADLITSVSPVSSRGSWNGGPSAGGRPGMTQETASSRRPSQVSQSSMTTPTTPHRPNLKKKKSGNLNLDRPEKVQSKSPAHPIYLYSNFNFVDVERYLHIISPPFDGFQLREHQEALSGDVLPPGLRFPSGSIVGDYLLLSGTYLSNTSQDFAIWALNIKTNVWKRVEISERFRRGSWNKGAYCEALESFVILGHRDRSLVEDYNHRQANFDHITLLNLEAFGIFESTLPTMSPLAQQVGLRSLADTALSDMELVTSDQTIINICSGVVSRRWPGLLDRLRGASHEGQSVSSLQGLNISSRGPVSLANPGEQPRSLYVPYPHALVHAFIVYLYTDDLPKDEPNLSTGILCDLVTFLATLDRGRNNPSFTRLYKLCRERLHADLSLENAASIHETCLLAGQVGLQVRAAHLLHKAPPEENAVESRHGDAESLSLATQTLSIDTAVT